MNQPKEKNPSVLGCNIIIFSGVVLGGFWIGLLLLSKFNWWLFTFSAIIPLYILIHARYIFIKPSSDSFYLGRQLFFLTFPAFSNIILLLLWYKTYNWSISVTLSLILGWIISKGLQNTLFAHEYTYRDDPDNRRIINSNTLSDRIQSYNLNLQGVDLAKKGSYKEAQHNFERAIELDPDNPDPRISLSNILTMDGRYTEAENQLWHALQLNPIKLNEQNIYNNLGNIYASKNNYREALKYYKKSALVHKPDFEIYYNLGLCLEHLGDWDEALSYFDLSNNGYSNQKAQLGILRVKQRIVRSPEMEEILSSYEGSGINFIECGNYSLSESELKIVDTLKYSQIVFFAGAGISFPSPSCLPKASDILNIIFHFLYELDKKDFLEILGVKNENEAYIKLCNDLMGIKSNSSNEMNYDLPFEPTFQALYNSFGYPAIRFVDLLDSGSPNLHHKMLAKALSKRHIVITTNFDKKIEDALNGSNFKILITDKDFQNAIDNSIYEGVLAKIHGDYSDYGSLALTSSGIAAGSDKSMHLGDDIDEEKGIRQSEQVYPRTFLSIPKALWLQNVLKKGKICVMGYSGSDIADIMPILTNKEYQCQGLWIEYIDKISDSVRIWSEINEERKVLKPENYAEIKFDMPSKVSKYFFNLFTGSQYQDTDVKNNTTNIDEKICSWVDQLRLRQGDGLVIFGRLYSQRGKWNEAKVFHTRALQKYEMDLKINEERWLTTRSNIGYVLDYLCKEDESLKIANEIKNYIEIAHKEDLYSTLYAKILIDIAGKLANTDKDYEAGLLVDKATKIAQKIPDVHVMDYSLKVAADRYFVKKDYQNALDIYLNVYKMNSDVFGDIRESCLSSMHAALCFAYLGYQYYANQMISYAENYANYSGDKALIEQVHNNNGYINGLFIGQSPALNFHEELITKAKMQLDMKNSTEIDELFENVGFGRYGTCLKMIDRMMKQYDNIDVQLLLLFIKSNVYHRMNEIEKEVEVLGEFTRLKENFPLAEHNLGNAFSVLKYYDDAEKHFLNAIKLMDGNYPLAYCNLGLLYCNLHRTDDAKAQLEKAEKLKAPENSLNMLRKRISETT